MAFAFRDATVPDVISLTSWEKQRKEQLEQIVAGGLTQFLEVGSALAEIRNRRLYRVEFATFEAYVRSKFSLARSSADQLIRSFQTAQTLQEAGVELPLDVTPTSLRAISGLPTNDLKASCWQLAQRLCPGRTPSQPLVSRLCRIVRNCLEDPEPAEDDQEQIDDDGEAPSRRAGSYRGRRSVSSPEREVPFIRPITRLVNFAGFHPSVIVADIDEVPRARTVYSVCQKMIKRCEEVQSVLVDRFPELVPELTDTYVEHNQG